MADGRLTPGVGRLNEPEVFSENKKAKNSEVKRLRTNVSCG